MAATWTDVGNGLHSRTSSQALTEAAPTLATEGVNLDGVGYVRPVVKAPNGQTITSGFLRGYVWITELARWVRAPRADDDLTDATGLNEAVLPAIDVRSPDRLALIADSIVLSGGSTVTISLYCTGRSRAGERL